MREIKFRVWDKLLNRFYLEGDALIDPIGGVFSEDGKHWIFMQFTGLKDKNEKEIYEGDILKIRDCLGVPDKNISKVFFQNGQFQIENLNGEKYLLGDIAPYSEVIGNIQENPELLKP